MATRGSVFSEQVRRALDSSERLDIIDWVHKHRVIDGEAEPGPKDINRTPCLKEIYEAIQSQDPSCQIIAMTKGTQLGLVRLVR